MTDVWRMGIVLEPVEVSGLAAALENLAGLATGDIAVRAAIPREDDLFGLAEERAAPRPLGATIELTGSGGELPLEAARTLVDQVAPFVDLTRSTVAVGTLHVIERRPGDVLIVIAGRRDPTLDAPAFFDWWLNRHAPLVRRSFNGYIPFGYEQVHVDALRSRRACEALGVAWEPLDIYETLVARDPQTFIDMFRDRAFQQALIDDEAGNVDQSSIWCGGLKALGSGKAGEIA